MNIPFSSCSIGKRWRFVVSEPLGVSGPDSARNPTAALPAAAAVHNRTCAGLSQAGHTRGTASGAEGPAGSQDGTDHHNAVEVAAVGDPDSNPLARPPEDSQEILAPAVAMGEAGKKDGQPAVGSHSRNRASCCSEQAAARDLEGRLEDRPADLKGDNSENTADVAGHRDPGWRAK